MDDAIKIEWYDIDDSDRDAFLDWLHGEHLPRVQSEPGILWIGHYATVKRTSTKSHDTGAPSKSTTDDPSVPKGREYVLLTAAASPDIFFDPHAPVADPNIVSQLNHRREHREAVFIVETRVNGPEYRTLMPGTGPAPAMQIGNFNVRKPEDDFELARWYRTIRFPEISVSRGCIGMRKMVSVAGWPKHGILYEFTSMDENEENFEQRYRDAARGPKWQGRHVQEYVIHAPGAAHAGRRIWPKV